MLSVNCFCLCVSGHRLKTAANSHCSIEEEEEAGGEEEEDASGDDGDDEVDEYDGFHEDWIQLGPGDIDFFSTLSENELPLCGFFSIDELHECVEGALGKMNWEAEKTLNVCQVLPTHKQGTKLLSN
jgi:hypothetical protein